MAKKLRKKAEPQAPEIPRPENGTRTTKVAACIMLVAAEPLYFLLHYVVQKSGVSATTVTMFTKI